MVEKIVQILKNKALDIASLENAKLNARLRRKDKKHVNVPLFGFATCPTFTANPDDPKWLKLVREYVEFHYDILAKKYACSIDQGIK